MVAVATISSGFKLSAADTAKELFSFASNPVAGLVIGMVATALIQSSSTVTSIIVGLVAGGLPVSIAVPMVMGANIGTTITNTIVSIGHIRQGEEFRRAFAAATVHDFFNLLAVFVFLPLEIAFDLLEKIGLFLAGLLVTDTSMSMSGFNVVKMAVSPPVSLIQDSLLAFMPNVASGILMIIIGIVMIFLSITMIGKLLKLLMVGKAKEILHNAVGRGPIAGVTSGALMTVLVQSSSTTTSLIVPLAGTGVFSLRQVFPFTLGANIGTCITGLLAATAVSGANSIYALEIAIIHLTFNVISVASIYSIRPLRELPIKAAEKLSELAQTNKLYVLAYILGVFVVIPLVALFTTNLLG